MSKYHRLNALLELLAAEKHLSVERAAAVLVVSPATIRRDFDALAEQQLLTRTHGGAVSNTTGYALPLRYKSVRNVEQKLGIARTAADLVPFGAVVGLNGGTTATELARALATRADLHTDADTVTVVTNALNIANELIVRSHIKIVVIGGVPQPQSYELIGPLGLPVLRQLSLDMAFIGVDAFDPVGGARSHSEAEAAVTARIAAQARRVVVVADSSKLGRNAFAQILPTDSVCQLITDADADPGLVRQLIDAGVEVLMA